MPAELRIRVRLKNFLPYSNPTDFLLHKPISLIAGLNSTGKSALLKGILIPAAALTEKSSAIRKRTLFKKTVRESGGGPKSFHEALFGKQNLIADRRVHSIPKRFSPSEVLTHRKRKGSVGIELQLYNGPGSGRVVANISVGYGSDGETFRVGKGFANRLNNLDVLFLEPDNIVSSFFAQLAGAEFEDQLARIPGHQAQGRFLEQILSTIEASSRLINEVDRGKFRDRYSMPDLFISDALATGAKKELLIYMLHLLKLRNSDHRNWAALILIDELGQGLHQDQIRVLCKSLTNVFRSDGELESHVRIVATTHSPSIYKFLNDTPDLCDILWVMREEGRSPQVINLTDGNVPPEQASQLVLEHLGMTIYDLPRDVIFVEGRTDVEFYRHSLNLEDGEFIPIFGANVPKILPAIIELLPLSRERRYFAILDGAPRQIEMGASVISASFQAAFTEYRGLEEFILGIKPNFDVKQHWKQIQEGIERIRGTAEAQGITFPVVDTAAARLRLEPKGIEGARRFLHDLKKIPHLYRIAGRFSEEVLPDESREILEGLRSLVVTP